MMYVSHFIGCPSTGLTPWIMWQRPNVFAASIDSDIWLTVHVKRQPGGLHRYVARCKGVRARIIAHQDATPRCQPWQLARWAQTELRDSSL